MDNLEKELENKHKELYEEYKQFFEDGFESEEELREYDDWLENVYPDEGYFTGHITPELAKFLIENDKRLDLDYYELYTESLSVCYAVSPTELDFTGSTDDKLCQYYDFTGNYYVNDYMDNLIARSTKPYLLSEMCKEYGIKANTYEEFVVAMRGEACDRVGFEIDLSGKTPTATAYADISLPNEIHSLGAIPLSSREQAFVLKAAETVCREEKGMTFDDIMKNGKAEMERE